MIENDIFEESFESLIEHQSNSSILRKQLSAKV